MRISDEKRREVAARLRNGGIARDSKEAYVLLLSCVGIRPQLPATSTYEDAMVRLADLIDRPTCQMVECTVDHGYRSWGMRCTACGKEFEHVKPGFGWRFCPNCGSRVASGNE